MKPRSFALSFFLGAMLVAPMAFAQVTTTQAIDFNSVPPELLPNKGVQFDYVSLGLEDIQMLENTGTGVLDFALRVVNRTENTQTYRLGVDFHRVPKDDPLGPSSPLLILPLPYEYRAKPGETINAQFSLPVPNLPSGKYRVFVGGSGDTDQLAAKLYVRDIEIREAPIVTLSACELSGKPLESGWAEYDAMTDDINPLRVSCVATTKNSDTPFVLSVRIRDGEYHEEEFLRKEASATREGTRVEVESATPLLPGYYMLQVVPLDAAAGRTLGAPVSALVSYIGTGGKILDASRLTGPFDEGASIPIAIKTTLSGQGTYVLDAQLSSGGRLCAEPLRFTPIQQIGVQTGTFSLERPCPSPVLTMALLDGAGNVLDRLERTYAGSVTPVSFTMLLRFLALIAFILLAPFIILILWIKKYAKKKVVLPLLLLAITLSFSFFTPVMVADAAQKTVCGWLNLACTTGLYTITLEMRGTASFSPPVGKPGQTINGTYTVTAWGITWGPGASVSVNMTADSPLPDRTITHSYPAPSTSWPFSFTAGPRGTYTISALGWASYDYVYGVSGPGCYSPGDGFDWSGCLTEVFGSDIFTVATECSDFMDNDGDARYDFNGFPPDPDCSSLDDDSEAGAPLNCPASTANWNVGGNACTANYGPFNHGTTQDVTDSTGPVTGNASLLCTNGSVVVQPGATCVVPNTAPSMAQFSGEQNPTQGTNYVYTLSATDGQNDNVRYEIDWDGNGTTDTYYPSSSTYVPSGTAQSVNRTWPTTGSFTARARACDTGGLCSGWMSLPVTVTAACAWAYDIFDVGPPGKCTSGVPPSSTCTIANAGNIWLGECAGVYSRRVYECQCGAGGSIPPPPQITGNLTPAQDPVNYNTGTTLTGTVTGATSCTVNGIGATLVGNTVTFSTGNLTSDTSYTLTCTNAVGPTSADPVTIRVRPQITVNGPAPSPVRPTVGPWAAMNFSATANATQCWWSRGGTGKPNENWTDASITSPQSWTNMGIGWNPGTYIYSFRCESSPGVETTSGPHTLTVDPPLAVPSITPIGTAFVGQMIVGNTLNVPNAFRIENAGDIGSTLTLTSITVGGSHPGDFAVIGCPTPINLTKTTATNPSIICGVNFTPSDVGIRGATLTLTGNASASYVLAGEGIDPIDEVWDVGRTAIGRPRVRPFDFENLGPIPMPNVVIGVSGAGGEFTCAPAETGPYGPTCAIGDLVQGTPKKVWVRFAPTAAGTVRIDATVSATGYANLPTIPIRGTGVAGNFEFCEPGDAGCR